MLFADTAPGIHLVSESYVNWYIVEDDGRLTVVDTGTPRSWRSLQGAVRQIGRSLKDIEAIVLTHAHFDHVGFAERARKELGVPVWVHEHDAELARHPLRYDHERPRLLYPLRYPRAIPILGSLAAHEAFFVKGVAEMRTFAGGELDVPGRPRVIFAPGHTYGHCALHFADRDTLIAGDAVVTLDPYTGARGPRVVARAATADSGAALRSLADLAATNATTVLTGHGDPWRGGAERAAQLARAAGVA
jgi:glyoxylase-like metal-dependent hydrolase (beta-lactamase superfamily II)